MSLLLTLLSLNLALWFVLNIYPLVTNILTLDYISGCSNWLYAFLHVDKHIDQIEHFTDPSTKLDLFSLKCRKLMRRLSLKFSAKC